MEGNPYPNRRLPVGDLKYVSLDPKFPNDVQAYLEYGEKEILYDEPKLFGGDTYCNLGDANGGSAILITLGALSIGVTPKMYTIDTYKTIPNSEERSKNNCERFGVTEYITKLKGVTDSFSGDFEKDFFDFIFVDADHRYDSVCKDINNYVKLLKSDGFIGFHDTNQDGVAKAIRDCGLEKDNWYLAKWINRIKIYGRRDYP